MPARTPSTGKLGHFVRSVAGAYFRGSEEPDAAADLRHRMAHRSPTSASTCSASPRAEKATTAASVPTCSASRRRSAPALAVFHPKAARCVD
ncbi:MAG: hypothetical protein R2716_11380 [Microthrixaceae bacterium]